MDLCALARESLAQWLTQGLRLSTPRRVGITAGCFVSLHGQDGALRGCIGTISPICEDLALEVVENAISAGTRDPRFPPVSSEEMRSLVFEVSVLEPPEPIDGEDELDPRIYGLVLRSGGRRGVLLPDLEGVDTVAQQIQITRRKAGIDPGDPVDMFRFKVKKYHE